MQVQKEVAMDRSNEEQADGPSDGNKKEKQPPETRSRKTARGRRLFSSGSDEDAIRKMGGSIGKKPKLPPSWSPSKKGMNGVACVDMNLVAEKLEKKIQDGSIVPRFEYQNWSSSSSSEKK